MSEVIRERLYALLPAFYRLRDAQRGEALRALLAVIEQQLDAVERDIETTWDNWFIETCEGWVVPYIADALGITGVRSVEATGFSQRAYVANTLAYRRRKGTAAVLEQLARDLTGCPAHVVEAFEQLATTAHVNHVRLAPGATAELRSARVLERVGGPWDPTPRTADVRHIDNGRGTHNLPHIALHLWRLASWEIADSTARGVPSELTGYRFSPLGVDIPLFNRPETETSITQLAEPQHVAAPLSRRVLHAEQSGEIDAVFLTGTPPFRVTTVRADTNTTTTYDPLDGSVVICHLGDMGGAWPTVEPDPGVVAVDPELGRIVFNSADLPAARSDVEVLVDYLYGAPAKLGAGPYDRTSWVEGLLEDLEVTWQVGVSRAQEAVGTETVFTTVEDAIDAWNAYIGALSATDAAKEVGVIAIMDSRSYAPPTGRTIEVPAGATLLVVAADWPTEPDPENPEAETRLPGRLTPSGLRPHVSVGELRVEGGGDDSTLLIDGLLLEGELQVRSGDLGTLAVSHTSLVHRNSTDPTLQLTGYNGLNAALEVSLTRCVCEGIVSTGPLSSVSLTHSLIDHDDGLQLEECELSVRSTTVMGPTRCARLEASDALFTELVQVTRHQEGCARFSFVPDGSRTPRRFRCQPDLAVEGLEAGPARDRVIARVKPAFTSTDPADPGYGQLSPSCPVEIATGAEDGAEVGAFHHLQHAARLRNLRAALRQALRVGAEAGVFYES